MKEETRVVTEVGGPVDGFTVTVCVYGDELDPNEITRLLGRAPTRAGRKGDRKRPGSVPLPRGVWLLREEGRAPAAVAETVDTLLSSLPSDRALWREIAGRFDVRVNLGLFLESWNRGFDLPSHLVARIAEMGASFGCDIYAPEGEWPEL